MELVKILRLNTPILKKTMKQKIETNLAPAAIGPYSQATACSNLLFVSGQLPVDPKTSEMAADIRAQSRQSLENLKQILECAGSGMSNVMKTTVFLADMNDFAAMNEVYAEAFGTGIHPARSTVQVARLPKDALVEIEAIAYIE